MTNQAKKLINENLNRELKDSPIVQVLLKYDLDIIESFLNLGVDELQDMFSPLSHQPVILNPTRIKGSTKTLYELFDLNKWMSKASWQMGTDGQYAVAHPETNDVTLNRKSLIPLSNVELEELAARVDKIAAGLADAKKSKAKITNSKP